MLRKDQMRDVRMACVFTTQCRTMPRAKAQQLKRTRMGKNQTPLECTGSSGGSSARSWVLRNRDFTSLGGCPRPPWPLRAASKVERPEYKSSSLFRAFCGLPQHKIQLWPKTRPVQANHWAPRWMCAPVIYQTLHQRGIGNECRPGIRCYLFIALQNSSSLLIVAPQRWRNKGTKHLFCRHHLKWRRNCA